MQHGWQFRFRGTRDPFNSWVFWGLVVLVPWPPWFYLSTWEALPKLQNWPKKPAYLSENLHFTYVTKNPPKISRCVTTYHISALLVMNSPLRQRVICMLRPAARNIWSSQISDGRKGSASSDAKTGDKRYDINVYTRWKTKCCRHGLQISCPAGTILCCTPLYITKPYAQTGVFH